MKAPFECPICGSRVDWHFKGYRNDGFSTSKAVFGSLLFGPIGAVAGVNSKKKAQYHCDKCGYSAEYDPS